MLTAAFGATDTSTCGGGKLSDDVAKLQKALLTLSTQVQGASPGRTDGCLDTPTLSALAYVINIVPDVPSAVKTAVNTIAPMIPLADLSSTTKDLLNKAKTLVAQYAGAIEPPITSYNKSKGLVPPAAPPPSSTDLPSNQLPWYSWKYVLPISLGFATVAVGGYYLIKD